MAWVPRRHEPERAGVARIRRILGSMPRSPRCKTCQAPFEGPLKSIACAAAGMNGPAERRELELKGVTASIAVRVLNSSVASHSD
jgi:hypothetical protein